jgi:hypothetical protein
VNIAKSLSPFEAAVVPVSTPAASTTSGRKKLQESGITIKIVIVGPSFPIRKHQGYASQYEAITPWRNGDLDSGQQSAPEDKAKEMLAEARN